VCPSFVDGQGLGDSFQMVVLLRASNIRPNSISTQRESGDSTAPVSRYCDRKWRDASSSVEIRHWRRRAPSRWLFGALVMRTISHPTEARLQPMLCYRTVAGTHCVWCYSKEGRSMDNVDIVGHGATGLVTRMQARAWQVPTTSTSLLYQCRCR